MTATLIGTSALGLALLALGGLMMWKKASLKVVTWLWFFAAVTLSGPLVGNLRGLLTEAGKTSGAWFTVGSNVVLGIAGCAAIYVILKEAPLRKGKGQAKGYTPYVGLAAPLLLGAVTGGTLATLFGWVAGAVARVGGPVATFFGG